MFCRSKTSNATIFESLCLENQSFGVYTIDKTAVVTFGESLDCYSKAMKQRNWHVGPTQSDERDEYTNLGVCKN